LDRLGNGPAAASAPHPHEGRGPRRSPESLVEEIAAAFADLFPFVLLATSEDPWSSIASYLEADVPAPAVQAPYTIDDLRRETGFEPEQIQRWLHVLQRKKQIVLQGPPGTGKTYVAQRLARYLVAGTPGVVEVVQFHPAYAYEDFMQGIRPDVRNGALRYDLEHGQFLRFCDRARRVGEASCVLIIDEINRANLARVFGELMFLLEYRDQEVTLAAGGVAFRVPKNVFLIGTMNTADRSITRMDHALRRRFSFIRLRPEYEVLRRHFESQGLQAGVLVQVLTEVNAAIDDPNYEVGISYFMLPGSKLKDHLSDVWQCEIEPYLEEFFYDDIQRVEPFRWRTLAAGPLADWS
jgi:5-methylcytosine-specific restriction enzyme B